MSQELLNSIVKDQLKSDLPVFKPGDTVKVHVRIVEGDRERIQLFEGVVIKRRGGGISETFTVRKISYGVGVERTFPVHTPKIEKIDVVRRGRVRRAKLYYLRNLRGKAARIRELRYDCFKNTRTFRGSGVFLSIFISELLGFRQESLQNFLRGLIKFIRILRMELQSHYKSLARTFQCFNYTVRSAS